MIMMYDVDRLGKEVVNLVWELAHYLTNYKMYFEHMSFWGLDDVY